MFSNQTVSTICHICGGEIERERIKSCPTTKFLGKFVYDYRIDTVTHILSTLHQQTSLSQCLSWTSEKRRAVVIRNKGTALEPEGILQRFGSRVGFEKLANFILIPEYPKPTAAILLFVDSFDPGKIWRYANPINYFRKLAWNLDDVLRATTFSSAEWMKLLSPKKIELLRKPNSKHGPVPKSNSVNRCSTSSTNFLTSNDIKSMIGVTVLHTLNQFCLFNNWPPPIFQVNEVITAQTVYSLNVIVNEKTYKVPTPTLDKVFAARYCLIRFLSEFTFPTKDELYDCDSYKLKLRKFVEQGGLTMSDFKIYREADLHPIGRIYYYSISVNAQCYKSPIPGTTRQEGEYFAAFYCLDELKRKLAECASTSTSSRKSRRPSVPPQRPTETRAFPSTSKSAKQPRISKPISYPENHQLEDVIEEVGNEMENSENVSSSSIDDDIDDDDSLTVSESGSDSESTEEIQLSDDNDHDYDDEMTESDDDEVEVMEVCETSTHSSEKDSDAEITVLGEPKESEEIYLTDDSDIDEIVVLRKGDDSEGPMETNAKVKFEESVTPWPTIYLPSDYVNDKFEKPDQVLEKICLVCGWKPPVYNNNLESTSYQPNKPVEQRFSFRLSVHGREYRNERVEKTKAKAKEKVARICLLELCLHGQIPHPSIFQNISLDPVMRLINLSRCRELVLGENLKAKHTIIQHNNQYICKIQFNGKKYSKGGATYNEAKLLTASFCLERLCKENVANVFAHGSITYKTKNDLTNVGNEIFAVPVCEANKKVKNLSRQFYDTLAKMTIKENELEQSKKLLTTLENFLNKELPINVTLTQFSNSVPHIRNHCASKKLHIDIYLKPTNFHDDTQNLVHDALMSHREKNLFPGVKAKVRSIFDESGPTSRSISGTKFKILSKAGLTWLPDSFSVHMNKCANAEMEMCRFVDYMATFDPRFVPLLVIVRHWAEENNINFFKEKSKLKADDVSINSAILDWLVLCYLAGLKIIPVPRTILERPRTKSSDESGVTNPDKYKLFKDDPQFANQWRSSNYKGPEENSSAFFLQIFFLAKYFFSYFGKLLAEGNWILNTRDAELIYTPDFFKGSFITELTPYDLDKLRDMEINGKNLIDQTHKLVIVHPGLKSKWKIVVDARSKSSAEHVFKKMAKSGQSGESLLHTCTKFAEKR